MKEFILIFRHENATGKVSPEQMQEWMKHQKGYKNRPLTETQKKSNQEKSRVRARVEHIFGFVENSMNGSYIRTIGMARAEAKIGMMNIVYNICR